MQGDRGADDDGQQSVWEPVSQSHSASADPSVSGDSSGSSASSEPASSVSSDSAESTASCVSADSSASSACGDGDVPSEFVAGLFARLDAVLEDLADVRYPAMAPGEVRAAVRGLYARVARVQAQALRSLAAVDDRGDVIPTARPGKVAATFAQHALGLGPGKAAREAGTGRLLDREVGDLKVRRSGLIAQLGEDHLGPATSRWPRRGRARRRRAG